MAMAMARATVSKVVGRARHDPRRGAHECARRKGQLQRPGSACLCRMALLVGLHPGHHGAGRKVIRGQSLQVTAQMG